MALDDILKSSLSLEKVELTDDRIEAALPVIRQYMSFWRAYPDLFIDFLAGENSTFQLYFYQRIFLRVTCRYRYVYAVFPRAYSKSFLAIFSLMTRCILYPGAHLFVSSGGKEQAAGIIKEKFEEICQLVPAFNREINWKKTSFTKDAVKVVFKNGSSFDNIAARETSRGKRRHGGVLEECASMDGDVLNEVIIPIMNVSRSCADGVMHSEEVLNKSQLYITTAGYRNTFAYDKLIQLLIWQLVKPKEAMIIGGTWRVPVLAKLLDKNFVKDLKLDGTFNEAAFEREYESIWSGASEDSFFSADLIDKHRIIKKAEYEYLHVSSNKAKYYMGVDVGRKGCDSVITIVREIPQPKGSAKKHLVNIITLSDMHFEQQASVIKEWYFKYNATAVVLDANGLGIGLVDYMIKPQTDEMGGALYPDFGVINDPDAFYKQYQTDETEHNALYLIKANALINSEAHANVQSQLNSGKLKFLIDEKTAKASLMSTKVGAKMSTEDRSNYLRPYTLSSILREEMLNLREETEGTNIHLKQANKKIKKDKFSSFEYCLWYMKEEENRRKKKKGRLKDFIFMN